MSLPSLVLSLASLCHAHWVVRGRADGGCGRNWQDVVLSELTVGLGGEGLFLQNTKFVWQYTRGLLACMHLAKRFTDLSLHNTGSMSTGYLLTLLSSMFLLTKTLQVPVFSFLPFSLFEDTCFNFLTPGSNYCTHAGVSVELLYSW